jgi:hypothetical protein
MKTCVSGELPAKVEEVSDVARIGEVFDFGGVEEDGEVGILVMRVVSGSVVGIINQLDLLHEFVLGLVEVGAGGVDDHSQRAGLGDGLRHVGELFDGLQTVFGTDGH